MSRIPFVAAVVGALLIGGATTGGTHASWLKSKDLSQTPIASGRLDFTLTPPSSLSPIAKGSTGNVIVTLTDDSLGKNLARSLTTTATVSGTATVGPLKTVDATTGLCTTNNLVAYAGAQRGVQQVCAQITVPASYSGSSVSLSLSTVGQQTGLAGGNGWRRSRSLEVTVPVSILGCGTQVKKDEFPILWTKPSDATSSLVQLKDSSGNYNDVFPNTSSTASSRSFTVAQTVEGSWTYRIKFTGGATAFSNPVTVSHANNSGNSNMSCAVNAS